MEFRNAGDLAAAMTEFRTLIAAHPDYSAAYFHGGQTLEKLGRINEAKSLYARGIEITGATGDSHTQSELRAALDMLG